MAEHAFLTNRERVLFEIARHDKSDRSATLRAITEGAAHALDVARVGVWQFRHGKELVAVDSYIRDRHEHLHGQIVSLEDSPAYFAALLESRTIAAHDARADPRTFELTANYLGPLGITSMLDVPIWYADDPGWVLCHEHVGQARRWTESDVQFAAHLADLAALSLEAAARHAVERRWEAASEGMVEAVFVLDADHCVEFANRAGRRMLELAGGGRTLTERRDLLEVRDAAGRRLDTDAASVIATGRALSGELAELLFKATGERRMYRVTSAPFEGEGREGTVVVMADMSHEARLERLKTELLSGLAHELNTPLAVAKGYAQHLARAADLPPGSERMLDAILRATNRMEELIGDLVELTMITFGRIVLAREKTDLGDLVRTVIAKEGTKVSPRIHVSNSETVSAPIDRPRVAQAIHRVIDHAVRFSPEGSPIEVSIDDEGSHAVVHVRGCGAAIPPKERQRIFEPSVSARDRGVTQRGGAGVGLFLAREIAVRHGGSLSCESVKGGGCRFTLRLHKPEAA